MPLTKGRRNLIVGDDLTVADEVYLGSDSVLTWAGDTTLNRAAAGEIRSNGYLEADADIIARLGQGSQARIGSIGPGSTAGLLLGADTNLYRSGANILRTDDAFVVGGQYLDVVHATAPRLRLNSQGTERAYFSYDSAVTAARLDSDGALILAPNNTQALTFATDGKLQLGASADANLYRLSAGVIATDGHADVAGHLYLRNYLQFGASTGSPDTNLYRSAADTLKTDDTFNAAKLQVAGVDLGSWQTYTPTLSGTGWALGDAVVTARYCQIGKVIHVRVKVVWGSTSTFGTNSPGVSLPVTAHTSFRLTTQAGMTGGWKQSGTYYTWDSWIDNGGTTLYAYQRATGGSLSWVTATSPFTYAAGDMTWFGATYEAA